MRQSRQIYFERVYQAGVGFPFRPSFKLSAIMVCKLIMPDATGADLRRLAKAAAKCGLSAG
jgi:hypothetical protein